MREIGGSGGPLDSDSGALEDYGGGVLGGLESLAGRDVRVHDPDRDGQTDGYFHTASVGMRVAYFDSGRVKSWSREGRGYITG